MYLYFVLTPIHLKALCLLENSQSDGAHHLHTILCIHLLTLIKNMIKVFFSTPVCRHYQAILSVQTYCWLKSDASMAKKGISGKACQKVI